MAVAFHDLAPTTRALKGALLVGGVLTVLAFFSSIGQLALLSRDFSDAEGDANDVREHVIAVALIVVALVTIVVFSVWIHRAATNVRALGASGLTITPGWAVGWFLVPVANLFMPFRAMREIWKASHNPTGWASLPTAPIVGWWWAGFLADQFFGRLSGLFYKNAETVDTLRSATIADMISDVATVGATVAALLLVTRIAEAQARAHAAGAQRDAPKAEAEVREGVVEQ